MKIHNSEISHTTWPQKTLFYGTLLYICDNTASYKQSPPFIFKHVCSVHKMGSPVQESEIYHTVIFSSNEDKSGTEHYRRLSVQYKTKECTRK